MSSEVYLCGGLRTPIGRYGASLSGIRADDLASLPIKGLIDKYSQVDWELLDDVIFGCANQAGEDNRNVARMGSLLAGISVGVPGSTINRLCGSGMDAVSIGARAIKTGELEFVIAGGVESMSRAPYVMPKAETAFSRSNAV
ncbi:MAG: 3-oxoadipyl-CoA thiolase, partial [Betaproteobacteria bacterium]